MDQKRLDEMKIDWLVGNHDYTEEDGQPDDGGVDDALIETLAYYIEEDHVSLDDPDFEFFFRAYLHNNDYSYSLGEIRRAIDKNRRGGEQLITRMDTLNQAFAPLFKSGNDAEKTALKVKYDVTPYAWEVLRTEYE